jgi:hypothetical protein
MVVASRARKSGSISASTSRSESGQTFAAPRRCRAAAARFSAIAASSRTARRADERAGGNGISVPTSQNNTLRPPDDRNVAVQFEPELRYCGR